MQEEFWYQIITLLEISRVCTVVHYAVLEAIRAVYGIWQI